MQRTCRLASPVSCLALAIAAGAATAAPPRLILTEIPSVGGTPHNAMSVYAISSSGAITGQNLTHAFQWTPGSAAIDIHPTPEVLGSRGHAINAQGQVIGDACIPPPGGVNGPCGYYLFRYTPGQGAEQLNVNNAVLDGVGHFDALMNDSGVIAGTDAEFASNSRAIYFNPETGWADLTPLIPPQYAGRARVRGLTGGGEVILDAGPDTPAFAYSPWWGLVQLTPGPAVVNSTSTWGEFTGRCDFDGGSGAFRAGMCIPPQPLDPQRQFPESEGKLINTAGMVAGTWSGGVFLYTPGAGMEDLGLNQPGIELIGMNEHGDLTASFHTELYENIPVVKFRDGPAMLVQHAVDPLRTRLIVQSVTEINDNGQFVVTGRRPGSPAYGVAFLVTISDAPACPADIDRNDVANSADISGFLTLWLADVAGQNHGLLGADFNESGSSDSADISAFLGAWLGSITTGGC